MRPTYPQNLVCSPLDAVTCLLATDRISVMGQRLSAGDNAEQFPQSLMHPGTRPAGAVSAAQ